MSCYAHLLDDYNKTKKRLDLAEEQIARVTVERDAISTEAVRLVREAHARAEAAEKQVAMLRSERDVAGGEVNRLTEIQAKRAEAFFDANRKLVALYDWARTFGATLCPPGPDSYGEGVRAMKSQVASLLADPNLGVDWVRKCDTDAALECPKCGVVGKVAIGEWVPRVDLVAAQLAEMEAWRQRDAELKAHDETRARHRAQLRRVAEAVRDTCAEQWARDACDIDPDAIARATE